MKRYTEGFGSDPNLRMDMMHLLEEGETITGIGRIYGVSRDRVRTQMKRFGLSKREPLSEFTAAEVDGWVKEIISGLALGELAKRLAISEKRIGAYMHKHGYDIKQVKLERSKHRHDGKVFSYWTVLPGSHRDQNNNAVLDCQCICGEIRTVSFTNLLRGVTKSCGCMGYLDRKAYPWICQETGQTVISTEELSRTIGINSLTLHSHIHKNLPVIDSEGREWTIQLDKGISYGLAKASTIVWINQTTQEQVLGHIALAEATKGSLNTIRIYGAKRQSYLSSIGEVWIATKLQERT